MELLEKGDDYLLAQCLLFRPNTLIRRGELGPFIWPMSHPRTDAEFISETAAGKGSVIWHHLLK
jgi:hypothetical protein